MPTTPDPSPSSNEPTDPAPSPSPTHEPDLKPVYAVAGVTEMAVGALRRTVTGGQRWASQRLADLRYRREALAKQAEELRHLGERPPASAYDDLADRGQRALRDLRVDVVQRIDPAFDRIQQRIDAARNAIRTRALPEPRADAAAGPQPPVPVPVTEAELVPDSAVPTPAPDPVLVDETVPVEPVLVEDDVVTDYPATPRAD